MKSLKKAAFCYVAPLLSVFGLATAPLEVEAQCSDPAPCCIDWCSLLVPALVGAAAGAGTAAAINHKGKHGKRGERGDTGAQGPAGVQGLRGPPGDNPFIQDVNDSLTITFTIDSITFDGTDLTVLGPIIAVVSTPTGTVLTAGTFDFVPQTTAASQAITIGSPFFGDYVIGLQVPGHNSEVTIVYSIDAINTDRTDTVFGPLGPTTSVTLLATQDNAQVNWDFVFGPVGTVPNP
jgi:hypothetical protein